MKTKLILLFTLVLSFSISGASAQSYHDSKTQQARNHGYKHGRMTPDEDRRQAYQQKHFRKDTRHAKCNDGRISRSERGRNMRKHQMDNRYIYSYNHNQRSRF